MRKIKLFISLLFVLFVSIGQIWGEDVVTIYSESFGSTGTTAALTSYTGFSAETTMFSDGKNVNTHYSGSGTIGKNNYAAANLSSGYTGASGLSGVYHSGTAGNEANIIIITGINIKGYTDLSFSFGALGGSSSHEVSVSYSIDNGAEESLISSGAITNSKWTLLSQAINKTGNSITIKIKHKPTKSWMIRIDDIKITGKSTTPAGSTKTSV